MLKLITLKENTMSCARVANLFFIKFYLTEAMRMMCVIGTTRSLKTNPKGFHMLDAYLSVLSSDGNKKQLTPSQTF